MKEIKHQWALDSKVRWDDGSDDYMKSYCGYGNNSIAYLERWKFENKDSEYYGISIFDENKFLWLLSTSRNHGEIYLGTRPFLTSILEDKFYNHESWMFNGTIWTHGQLKNNLNYKKNCSVQMDTNSMPKRTFTIISPDKEKIIKLAQNFKLPLEEKVK